MPIRAISDSPISRADNLPLDGHELDLDNVLRENAGGGVDTVDRAAMGMGEMAGKLVSASAGVMRADCRVNAKLAAGFFQAAAQVAHVGAVALAVLAFPLTIPMALLAEKYHSRGVAPRHDEQYRAANLSMVKTLERIDKSSLANDAAIMDKVVAHAKGQNSPLTAASIKAYVAAGQQIANGLVEKAASSDPSISSDGSTVHVDVDGQKIEVRSSVYTTRALSWYLMAMAAKQDVAQEALGQSTPSNMVTLGSFLLKDPNNTFFEFLSAAPTAGDRISTHFAERADHTRRHAWMCAKPIQRGIEDYSNGLPGQRATMLFDKLRSSDGGAELFIKFELAGCPPVFQTASDIGVKRSAIDHVVQFFSAIYRNLAHAASFLQGQKKTDANTVLRQEHIVKGLLKGTVAGPFLALIKMLNGDDAFNYPADGLLSLKQATVSAKQLGLPFVHDQLRRIIEQADERGRPDIVEKASAVKKRIEHEEARLGIVSHQHGIRRRGAEVHLSWGG